MTTCILCGGPTADDGVAHWTCGGIVPDDERHAAISVADHIVRLLTPKRTQQANGKATRKPAPVLLPSRLRARLRPELVEYFDDGVALALAAGAIRRERQGGYRLAPTPRRKPAKQRDDGSEPGLFDLPREGTT